jgi:phosphoribosylamine--glycine ligase
MERILKPVVKALADEGCPYRGVLYAGLMVTGQGPKVLEFNVRLGDPEAQVVLPLLDGDLLPILEGVADGDLSQVPVRFRNEACVSVVLASGGYPGKYETGHPISGLDRVAPGTLVFHAGTRRHGASVVTDGGRVLNVVCTGENVKAALDRVYREVLQISFTGMHYRRDIGARALK